MNRISNGVNRSQWYRLRRFWKNEKCCESAKFSFAKNDVKKLLEGVVNYSEDIKKRVCEVLFFQMDKYGYLFGK